MTRDDGDPGEPRPAPPPRGLTLWLPPLLIVVALIGIVRHAARPISDPDAWWHLRVGRMLWSGEMSLTRTEPLSSFATEAWIPRDWLPQLVSSQMERWFGLPGVAWLYGAAMAVFVLTAYFVSRRQADPLPAASAAVLGLLGAAGSLSPRPQIVTFIFLLIFVGAWLGTATDLQPRWWLVPMTWLWASSHGMWYLGIAVGLLVVVGLLLDQRLSPSRAGVLALVPGFGLVAAALTPAGPTLLLSVVQESGKWAFVTEWAPPDFKKLSPALAMLMVAVVALTWARIGRRLSWAHTLLLLMATALVLVTARTVAAGAAMLVPLVALTLQVAMYGRDPVPVVTWEGRAVVMPTVAAVLAFASVVPHTSATPGNTPNALNDEIEALPPGSAVLNAYELGGWLHWRHPKINTVIDGFTDGYTVEALRDYVAALAASPGWQEYVATTGADVALLGRESPLTTALTDQLYWVVVGSDGDFVLLRSPGD